MSQEVPVPATEQQAQAQGISLQNPTDVARATAGLVLQEAVNLGEINPAMARRFGERMDQVFGALMRGAGIRWGKDKDLQFVWPEIENPFLAAAAERKKARDELLASSTRLPEEIPTAAANADWHHGEGMDG